MQVPKVVSADYPIADKVSETYDEMIRTWKSSLAYCDDQMTRIKKRENYLKSIKVIQDQQDALQVLLATLVWHMAEHEIK